MTDGGLENRTIVVTRDPEQAGSTVAAIRKRGGSVVMFPTIGIVRSKDRSDSERAAADIDRYDWLVFTSTNTIDCFDELLALPDPGSLRCSVAAIGRKTADALARHGIRVDLVPDRYSARGLLDRFEAYDVAGKRFLQPCSRIARTELAEGLKARGARVDRVVIYETAPNRDVDPGLIRRGLDEGAIDCLTFFSPSAFEYFADIVGGETLTRLGESGIPVAVIGPTTAKAVEARGISRPLLPRSSDEESLVAEIARYFATN